MSLIDEWLEAAYEDRYQCDDEVVEEDDDEACEWGHTWLSWVSSDCQECETGAQVAAFFGYPTVSVGDGLAYHVRQIHDGWVMAVAVGDNRERTFDAEDVTVLGDGSWCTCGSTTCGWAA